jgi:hypothetical protein
VQHDGDILSDETVHGLAALLTEMGDTSAKV